MSEPKEIPIDISFEDNAAVICSRILYGLMLADGEFSIPEKHFLKNTMDGLGLTPEERKAVSKPLKDKHQIRLALQRLDPEVRERLMEALFQVALVDGVLHKEEMKYIKTLRKMIDSL